MARQLYIFLLALHPARFRYRFAFEMLAIFDEASANGSTLPLLADGVRSLVRQWVHPYRPVVAAVPAGSGAPVFHLFDTNLPNQRYLMTGATLTLVLFSALTISIGRGGRSPGVSMGAFDWMPSLFGLDADGAFAQDAGKKTALPEIQGVVLEMGSDQPVVEAEVTLGIYGLTRPRNLSLPPQLTVTTKTDTSGSFVFRPDDIGDFDIHARKDGYTELRGMPGEPSSSQDLTLTAANPSREVRLFLSRPCRITGLVVDEDTGKPITNLRVGAVREMQRGVFLPFREGEGATDGQGRFVVTNLTPGNWAVEVIPQKYPKERVLSKFSERDLKLVDQDFEHSYWPGGHGVETVSPVVLLSGATIDLGVLRAKKAAYYRVHVRFPGWNCGSGDTTAVLEHRQDGRFSATGGLAEAPCGQDVLVTGFPPGARRLMFAVKTPQGETTGGAAVAFAVGDENIEVTATLERPLALNGVIIAADGARLPDLSSVTLRLGPASRVMVMDLSTPVKADADGKFRVQALPVEPHSLTVTGVGAGYYVKEIRYNGFPVAGDIIPVTSSAQTQTLTVVLDDKPAVITGIAVDGGKPVSHPIVILAKWPLPSGGFSQPTTGGTGDDKGRFQFGGLAPGEYRVIALTMQALPAVGDPDTIQRALAAAPKIEVGANATVNVSIEVTELR